MLSGTSHKIDWVALHNEVEPALHARQEEPIGFVNHCENAMVGLNQAQATMVQRLQQHYAHYLSCPRNQAMCDQEIQAFIINEYHKAPVIYDGARLPIEYDARLNQSRDIELAYLTHPAHSAFRYLVLKLQNRANSWMHPDAEFLKESINREGFHYQSPELGQEQLNKIRAMWLALNDMKFMISESYTRDSAKQMFLNVFATLARVHNWDKSRPVTQQVINEFGRAVTITKTRLDPAKGNVAVKQEYDDLDKDRPTCLDGVTTRTTQFVMLTLKVDPNERTLNANLVKEKFREEMVAAIPGRNTIFNTINKMDLATLTKLQADLDELVPVCMCDCSDLEEHQKALLLQLQSYSTLEVRNFLDNCKAFFGDYRFTQALKPIQFQSKPYANYGQLALAIAQDPWGMFYDQITQQISKKMSELRSGKSPVVNAPLVGASHQELMNVSLADFSRGIGRLSIMPESEVEPTVVKSTAEVAQEKILAEAQRKMDVSRLITVSKEAEIGLLIDQQELVVETARQAVINFAVERRAEGLADRMVDAGINEIVENLEHGRALETQGQLRELDQQIAQLQALLRDQQFLSAQMEREHQRECERKEQVRKNEESIRVEVARLEARRKAEEARLAEVARLEARRKAEEARLAEVARLEALRKAEAARLTTLPLLAAYNALRQQPAPVAIPNKINPEIDALFTSEPARQVLAVLNANIEAVSIINQRTPKLVETLLLNVNKNAKVVASLSQYKPEQVVEFLNKMQNMLKPAQMLRH